MTEHPASEASQFASISAEWELIPVVFLPEGRLVYVTEKWQLESYKEAVECIQKYFPDARYIEDYNVFIIAYRDAGWRTQHLWSTRTQLLCRHCNGAIRLNADSRGAGNNAPWGALIWHRYHCTQCGVLYSCASQNRQYGTSHEWFESVPDQPPYQECSMPPSIPPVNAHGFTETVLISAREYEKEKEEGPYFHS
jgi:hypothetical protein